MNVGFVLFLFFHFQVCDFSSQSAEAHILPCLIKTVTTEIQRERKLKVKFHYPN